MTTRLNTIVAAVGLTLGSTLGLAVGFIIGSTRQKPPAAQVHVRVVLLPPIEAEVVVKRNIEAEVVVKRNIEAEVVVKRNIEPVDSDTDSEFNEDSELVSSTLWTRIVGKPHIS